MKKHIQNTILAVTICLCAMGCGTDSSDGPAGGNDGKGGSLAIFALKGDYLYTVDHMNLKVFKIDDIENPINVGGVNVGFDIETLFSFKEYLFIGSRSAMYIYDVKTPENPKELAKARHFNACDPVVANDTHAFVTLHTNSNCGNNQNALIIYDIKDPKDPKKLSERQMVKPQGLVLYKNFLAICDDELKIFDITDPGDSKYITSKPGNYKDVLIYNNTLFAFGENQISQYKWEGENFKNLNLVSTLEY